MPQTLTPSQVTQYYAEEGSKAMPLSALQWLAKQGNTGGSATPTSAPQPVTLNADAVNTPATLYKTPAAPAQPNYTATLAAIPSIDSIVSARSPEQTAAETTQKTLQERLLGVLSSMGGRGNAEVAAEQNAGIPDLEKQLGDVNAQIRSLQAEAQAIPLRDQEEAQGRGITAGGLAPIEASKLRSNTIHALGLSAIAATLQGNLGLAQAQVQKRIAAQFDPLQSELTYLKQALDFNSANMNDADKEQAAIIQGKLQERQDALNAHKSDVTTTMGYVLTAARNGAPTAVLSSAQQMSPVDAIQALKQWLPADAVKDGGFTLSKGQSRYDANGKLVATAPVTAPTSKTPGIIQSGKIVATPADIQQGAAALKASASQGTEADGKYADPNLYLQMYEHWVNSGGKPTDFFTHYPFETYINPANTWLAQSISDFNNSGSSGGAQTP